MFKILVPVDGSQNAIVGARQAAKIAACRPDAIVYLVNAQPILNRHISRFVSRRTIDEMRAARARSALEPVRRLVEGAGVAVRSVALRGEPAGAIARFAKEEGIDQIVVGASRKSPLLRFLTGSITKRLLGQVNAPVAVVAGTGPGRLQRWGIPAGVGASVALFIAAE